MGGQADLSVRRRFMIHPSKFIVFPRVSSLLMTKDKMRWEVLWRIIGF
jgi:hypothetical protein